MNRRITLVVGARPNFIKIAPIIHALKDSNKANKIKWIYRLVHTGQHYDTEMSDTFFKQLNIPEPDINLGCGSGSQAEMTASIMVKFEKELIKNPADLVLVVGDVTSTMACSIVAKKLNTKVAHVEAGIRSYDLGMPEEINRMVTDAITDYFFTTTTWATQNLKSIGVNTSSIYFVGNVMIDTLRANENKLEKPIFWNDRGLKNKNYFLMTLHRPSNVDEKEVISNIITTISTEVENYKVIFPVHPRTKKIFTDSPIKFENIEFVTPLGYHQFNYLLKNAKCVITDSGGVTEEATIFDVPCITLRENTERPETVEIGSNVLVGRDLDQIKEKISLVKNDKWKRSSIPEKWDGKASNRIIQHLNNIFG